MAEEVVEVQETENSNESEPVETAQNAPTPENEGDGVESEENESEGTENDSEDSSEGNESDSQKQKLAGEAKKYRLKLRETESQLSAAHDRIEDLQRKLIETSVEGKLGGAAPSALWRLGASPATFAGEDGEMLPPAQIQSKALEYLEEFGIKRAPTPSAGLGLEVPPNRTPNAMQKFGEAFKPKYS